MIPRETRPSMLAFAIASALAAAAPPAAPASGALPAPAGHLVSATETVEAQRNGATPSVPVSRRVLAPGAPVFAGETLRTGTTGAARFLMADRTILDLGPASVFRIERFDQREGPDRDVTLTVTEGKLRASVNRPVPEKAKFVIRTRTAVMGVRGTELVVDQAARNGPSQLTVLHGRVEVTDPQRPSVAPVSVPGGTRLALGAVGSASLPAAPTTLSPQAQSQVASSSRAPDATFRQSVAVGGTGAGASTASSGAQSQLQFGVQAAATATSPPDAPVSSPTAPAWAAAGPATALPAFQQPGARPLSIAVKFNR